MNDRALDNQFPANSLSPEQLRQLQNIAALTGQGLNSNLGLLGSNLNLLNPMALQNLLNPILANTMASNSTPPNLNDSPSTLDQQQQQQQQQPQLPNIHQVSPQNLSFKRRGRRPKQFATIAGNSLIPPSNDVASSLSMNNFGMAASGSGQSGAGTALDNQLGQRLQLQQAIKQLRQQQQRQQMQQHHQQHNQHHQQQHQQIMQQEFTQRLQQQLQQIVQQSQRQQPQPSNPTLGADAASLTVRQQPSLQNSLPPGLIAGPEQQKRKRGRPPLSAPSTSAGSSSMDYSYLNMFAAVKSQQERDRLQRESKQQQERQREIRQQQERERQRDLKLQQERAERQRELKLAQDRERQRMEMERQRKAQHRLALQDIDRERRRQHMLMVRNLDAYKRNEEREKTMNAMMAEKNKQLERRMYQKRLEVELVKEIRKPVDDMMLKNHKPLATLNRIPGLKLPGKAFADLLMSYEFLFNFGETVGLELKEIPDINTLQLGLLNLNTWAEDQFISVLYHLCMFAVKDPRFPYTGSTKEIESLERTNEGLSQLLHFYLQVLTLNAKTDMEHELRLYKLIEQKYFLSLNATQKAEMLAFICNELLCSQTVTKQMEDTIENVAKLRKDKWVLENELRKYRLIKTKRESKEEAEQKAKEAAAMAASINTNGEMEKTEDGKSTDGADQNKSDIKKEEDEKTSKPSLTNGSSLIDSAPNKRENETDTSIPNNTTDLDDLESGMTNDELNKKIENLTRQYNKTSNKLDRAINSMRACPLGQDRFRRRYWVLPQVGGVFIEGMESSEPEELENNRFTEEELAEYDKEQQLLNELANNAESVEEESDKMEIKPDKDDEESEIKDEPVDVKDEEEPTDIKEEDAVDPNEIKDEPKLEIDNGELENKVVPEVTPDDINTPQVPTIPWFSILPRITCDFYKQPLDIIEPMEADDSQKKVNEDDGAEVKAELTSEELRSMRHEICPTLAKRLEELEAEQYDMPRKIHPQYQCGWWRITDAQQLKSILSVLHERGARERILHKHLTKHFQYACNSCKNATVDFQITSYDRQLAGKNYGAPMPHTDDDSADDLKDGEEDEEEEEEVEESNDETGDDKAIQQAAILPAKKAKRRKTTRSARSRRLRARAAARKKVENSKNKLAQR